MEFKRKTSMCSLPDQVQAKHLRRLLDKDRSAWDKYCFTCHTIGTTLYCNKCIRSYHINCIRNVSNAYAIDGFVCSFCLDDQVTSMQPSELNNALKFLMKRLYSDRDFQTLKTLVNCPAQSLKALSKPIDLTVVHEKVDKLQYQSLAEFMSDILWIEHNCLIISIGDFAKRRILKQFVRFCGTELFNIDVCCECYCNANERPADWFTRVCEHPHVLLWARYADNYWPAKAMAVRKTDDRIYVRFFGQGCRNTYVTRDECFLYSTKHPKGLDYQRMDSYKTACREVDEHIKNITQRFGAFRYGGDRVWFKPHRAVQQLNAMIPGLDVSGKPANRFFNATPFKMDLPSSRRRASSADFWEGPIYQPKVQLKPIRAPHQIANNNNQLNSANGPASTAAAIATKRVARSDANQNISGGPVDGGAAKNEQSPEVINILSDSDTASDDGDDSPNDGPAQVGVAIEANGPDQPTEASAAKPATPNACQSTCQSTDANPNEPIDIDAIEPSSMDRDIVQLMLDDTDLMTTPEHVNHSTESNGDPCTPEHVAADEIDNSVGGAAPSSSGAMAHGRRGTTEVVDGPMARPKAADAGTPSRRSFLNMITSNFDFFEQQLQERDDRIDSQQLEIDTLKRKLCQSPDDGIQVKRLKSENEMLRTKLAAMKHNYRSVLTSFGEAKRIQEEIFQSYDHVKAMEVERDRAFAAIKSGHDAVIAKAKSDQRETIQKLAVAWGRQAD